MVLETGVQSQVESCQRLQKWYLMQPCLTPNNIRYRSMIKCSNPGNGVAPFPTPRCRSYQKDSFRVTLMKGRQLYFEYRTLAWWLQCSIMARETWVQSQNESYQRLTKFYLIHTCLTLSIIKYESRVNWINPGKRVAFFSTPWLSSYWKGSFRVTLDYGRQLYLFMSVCVWVFWINLGNDTPQNSSFPSYKASD